METYGFTRSFELGGLRVSPVYIRVEQLSPIIPAHRHSNTSYEIHYTAQGHGTVLIEGERYLVEPDTLYVTGPNVLHAQFSAPEAPVIEYCLYLNCRTARHGEGREQPLSLFRDTGFWMGRDSMGIPELLRRLVRERREEHADMEEMTEALLRETVVCLNRSYAAAGTQGSELTARTESVPESRLYPQVEDAFFYRHATLTLSELASLMSLSERQTQRFLREHYGKSFTQKRTDAQMAAAAELLRTSSLSVTAIGEQIGFSSVEHFSGAFRRYFHMSPSQFRRGAAQNVSDAAPIKGAASDT